LTRTTLGQESLMTPVQALTNSNNFPGMLLSKTNTQTTTTYYRQGMVEPIAFEASTTTHFRATSLEPVN
jgi:hypothetical protein